MPSCSSKLSILRGYEFSDFIENFEDYESGIVHLLFSLYLSCSSQIVNDLQVPWCCVKTNIFSNQLSGSLKLFQSFDSDVFNIKHIFIFDLLTSRGGQQIAKNNRRRDKLVGQTHFNRNVICLNIIYFCLRLFLFYILKNQYKLTQVINTVNYISYGNIINGVMEVDETFEEVNSHMSDLPNGNEINVKSPSDVIKSEYDRPSVIKSNQIMNKFEFSHRSSSVTHPNSIDGNIRGDKIGSVFNGDIDNCFINLCDESTVDLCNDSTVDIEDDSQTETKFTVKNEEQANGEVEDVKLDNSESCEPEEKKPNDIISEVKAEDGEKVKLLESTPNDTSLDKNKSRDKNDSTSLNHVSSSSSSSSSSSRKHESQSRSHQSSSSSSSRHKYKDSRDDRHKSSSSSSRSNEVSSSRKSEDKSKSDSRSKSRSCHHKPDEKCHCKSRHHESHHHSKKSKKFQSVKTQCSSHEIAYELLQNKTEEVNPYFTRVPWVPHPQLANLKYGRYYRIEVDRNGGASVCHLYMDEISHLSEEQMKECAIDFIKLSYSEDENECAYHVMGIVHGAAAYLPDLVDYMADHYPTLTVKTGSLASRDNHTTTMSQYRDEVYKTYSNGTFRYAPLDQLSICGVLGEEVGAYFPDFVARLEQSPFMKPVMPWSFLSVVQTDNPRESNDGPIFWVRPGEQMLPANEALKESARPKKRRNNELDNLAYIAGSRSSEARESLFMDRTKAHADQVGVDYGISNTAPTAAVGVLKAVNCGHPEHGNRATKDVVAFHAQDYSELLEILMLDLYEPPQTQCTKWIEVSKLNTMRREGIRYAHIQLHDNDVYYLPRKIIHQFQTISSVASVAWHIRYREYFSVHGAPNLHTPTGINKGQVFYEKKNVAVYCPPLSENELLAAVANGESGLKTPKKSDRLREYSPFKHSPRKLHKHQSPRSAPKKDRSESVPLPPPPPRPQTNSIKKEFEEGNGDSDRKSSSSSSSSSSKKRERSRSAERRSSTDRGNKREHDSESRKTSDRSESSHSRRSSGERTPSKKEHRSQDGHSSHHRKEVKNLDSEFSSKKDKSSRERSPKSKHERKRSSDESRHEGSSKHRRHDDSSKSRSSSSSGKHEKSREHGSSSSSSVSNGDSSHKVKTEDKKDGEREGNLKRKHGDSPDRSPAKKIKEENPDPGVVENGRKSPETSSESQSRDKSQANGLSVKEETSLTDEKECKIVNKYPESSETFDENGSDEREASTDVISNETNSSRNDFDLRKHGAFAGFYNQVPSPTAQPTVNSPTSKAVTTANTDSTSTNSLPESTFVQANSHHPENAVPSKEKTGDVQLKKLKKKVVKKENESYDLLGDIMSQMDKNK